MGDFLIVDSITARPGQEAAIAKAYMADYAPGAEKRGMRFVSHRTTPPLHLKDGGDTLTFTWAVDGLAGWWQMRRSASADKSTQGFWAAIEPLTASRDRRVQVEISDHV